MIKRVDRLTLLTVLLAALLLLIAAPTLWAGDDDDDNDDEEIPFSKASIYFELNDTDGDLGIHALIDGEPWKQIQLENANERMALQISTRGNLRRHGMTELFFESAEPDFDELDPSDFFQRFPPGEWEVEGQTIDGEELESEMWLSHVLAAPPGNVLVSGVEAAEDCDEDVPVVSQPVIISWDPVMQSHPELGETGPIEVELYQLVVEREEPTSLVLTINLPPDVTSFELPEDFMSLGEEFKYEILVRETTGNQTAIESCFELE